MSLYIKSTACFNPVLERERKHLAFLCFVETFFSRLASSRPECIPVPMPLSWNGSLLVLQPSPAEQGPQPFLLAADKQQSQHQPLQHSLQQADRQRHWLCVETENATSGIKERENIYREIEKTLCIISRALVCAVAVDVNGMRMPPKAAGREEKAVGKGELPPSLDTWSYPELMTVLQSSSTEGKKKSSTK